MISLVRPLLKNTTAWRLLRGIKRSVLPGVTNAELPPEQCRGRITWQNPPPVAEVGSMIDMRFQIENRAGEPWMSSGSNAVRLQFRWLDRFRKPFGPPALVQSLPATLYPGEPCEVAVSVPAPAFVGDFILAADFVWNGNEFANRNPESLAVATALPIIGSRTTDIDYHEVFRTANLPENHWWVVGAYHTQEQYERSSRERLEMLQDHGITQDSHVLDVGCGTGQMASVLLPYLSEKGGYAGTDIGREAIDFCRGKFRRKNFQFEVGDMTKVPFREEGRFDYAIFFSVFTHTFLDESVLLMAEAKRLLKPTGVIIVDVITSDLVERAAGHRGEMIVNKDYFLRLAATLGYRSEVIGRWPWNPQAERFMFKLSR